MAFLRSLFRFSKLTAYFLVAAAELVIVTRPQSIEKRADWLHRFCGRVLRGFGVELNVVGKFPPRGALISNHLSYVDIIVYSAMSPVVFCAKAEMEGVAAAGVDGDDGGDGVCGPGGRWQQ